MAVFDSVLIDPKYIKEIVDAIENLLKTGDKFIAVITQTGITDEIKTDPEKVAIYGDLPPIRAIINVYKGNPKLKIINNAPSIGMGWGIIGAA